ncbi:Clp protease N-terminal domain-containing protein [Glycomyces sp. NPDC021274]|uniref:Clp protease N-terminal domain-containing protein n=1 Tax=Glycomyces sp. NPDC021274 TaxID=3155120 RepID=UPI0033EFA296
MPKINVYLPDELAEAVKEAGLPVSAICQRALEQSVKRLTAIRAAVTGELDAEHPAAGLTHFTERARHAITLGVERARASGAPAVGSEHLLYGLLAEGGNLALQVLRVMEVEPEQIARELSATTPADAAPSTADRFDATAANALELAITEAITLGHNYVGCEHLLLGLVTEPDGGGGQALRAKGVEARSARGAVVAALAGYGHLRATTANAGSEAPVDAAAVLRQAMQPIVERLERLEAHVGLTSDR